MERIENEGAVAPARRGGMFWRILAGLSWVGVGIFGLLALLLFVGAFDGSGTDPAGRGLSGALGVLLLIDAFAAGAALLLARFWRGLVVIAALLVVLPIGIVGFFTVNQSIETARSRREDDARRSGDYDFENQPALLAVAHAISQNDRAAILAGAKAVPDLQASGRDGKTLLYFAVDVSLTRPQLADAVQALLEAGADPNFTNEHAESYALARASKGPVRLLRMMLDAGGNPNGHDASGNPIILTNWDSTSAEEDERARLDLLLDRGADINAALPVDGSFRAGYTLLLLRTSMGVAGEAAYRDALHLLERGADPRREAADGTTMAKLIREQRRWRAEYGEPAPAEFEELCRALINRGVVLDET